jgi:hypothetical protein
MARSLAREVGIVFEGHRDVTEKRRLHPQKRALVWINLLGGTAVLASYAWNLLAHPEAGGDFWGGVPAAMQSGYVVTMLLAATGYFAFTRFIFRLRPAQVKIAGRFDYRSFQLIYALILVPSALWMPLTFAMIQDPSAGLWFAQHPEALVSAGRVRKYCVRLPDGGAGRAGVAGLFPRLV